MWSCGTKIHCPADRCTHGFVVSAECLYIVIMMAAAESSAALISSTEAIEIRCVRRYGHGVFTALINPKTLQYMKYARSIQY